jgi:hypothetical protein
MLLHKNGEVQKIVRVTAALTAIFVTNASNVARISSFRKRYQGKMQTLVSCVIRHVTLE